MRDIDLDLLLQDELPGIGVSDGDLLLLALQGSDGNLNRQEPRGDIGWRGRKDELRREAMKGG